MTKLALTGGDPSARQRDATPQAGMLAPPHRV